MGQEEHKGDFFPAGHTPEHAVCVLSCGQTSTLKKKKKTQWELRRSAPHPEPPVKPARLGGARPPGTHTAPALEAAG